MEIQDIIYFNKPGKHNTETVRDIVQKKLSASHIKYLVIPSSRGNTAQLFQSIQLPSDVKLIVVTLHSGFKGEDRQEFPDELRNKLESQGVEFLTCSHSLSGLNRSISNKFGGTSPVEIIAQTLRLFCGNGLKVAVEIAVMAADAGLIPTNQDVICVGGTHGGVDTAAIIQPAHMNNFFDLRIKEILAIPREA